MSRIRSDAGFSVLEMVVAMVLLLVIGAVATPVVSEYGQQFQTRAAMDRLTAEIGRARMQAMAQSAFVRVRLDDGHLIRERSLDGTDYELVGTPYPLPAGISASMVESGALTFDSTGVSTSPSTISIQAFGESKTLYTSILGRVTPS